MRGKGGGGDDVRLRPEDEEGRRLGLHHHRETPKGFASAVPGHGSLRGGPAPDVVVALDVLLEVVLPVKRLPALGAGVVLAARVRDHVPRQVLVPLEGLAALLALVRSVLEASLALSLPVLV